MTHSNERRELELTSLAEVMAEAERLAGVQVRTTGNYSLGQIFKHLAITMDVACGHTAPPPVKLSMRLLGPLMRPIVLKWPMRPGFKLPANAQSMFWPDEDIATEDGIQHLRESIARFEQTDPLPRHAFFGKMNRSQSHQLQCRHCTLHLSFVHPVAAMADV